MCSGLGRKVLYKYPIPNLFDSDFKKRFCLKSVFNKKLVIWQILENTLKKIWQVICNIKKLLIVFLG